jgi:hypothetical protein
MKQVRRSLGTRFAGFLAKVAPLPSLVQIQALEFGALHLPECGRRFNQPSEKNPTWRVPLFLSSLTIFRN